MGPSKCYPMTNMKGVCEHEKCVTNIEIIMPETVDSESSVRHLTQSLSA